MRAFLFVGVGIISLTAACAPLSKRTHYERWAEEMVRIHAENAAEEAAEAKAKGGVGIGIGGGGIGIGVHTGTSTPASNYVAPGGAPPPPSRVIRPSPPPPPPPPDDAVY